MKGEYASTSNIMHNEHTTDTATEASTAVTTTSTAGAVARAPVVCVRVSASILVHPDARVAESVSESPSSPPPPPPSLLLLGSCPLVCFSLSTGYTRACCYEEEEEQDRRRRFMCTVGTLSLIHI